MIDLLIDNDGDLVLTNDLQLVDGVSEIEQELKIILKTRQGEFFGDPTMGLDHAGLFIKKPNLSYIADSVVQALQQEERVATAEVTSIDLKGRTLEIAFVATLTTGENITAEVSL